MGDRTKGKNGLKKRANRTLKRGELNLKKGQIGPSPLFTYKNSFL